MTRRRPGFALQIYVMQIVLITVVAVAFTALAIAEQADRVRHDNEDSIRALALTGAAIPGVVEGMQSADATARIQPIIAALREASEVDYITVVGMDGIRVAHTNPQLIGLPVSSDHAAVRAGHEFAGVEDGPTGRTFRVKVPIRADGGGGGAGADGGGAEGGAVVGTFSLGIAETRLTSEVLDRALELVLVAGAAVLLGSALSWALTQLLRRRLYGVDPDEIRTLLQTRETVLDGIGDGLVVVGADDDIVLANAAAQRLLGRGEPDGRGGTDGRAELMGRPAHDVLPGNLAALLTAAGGDAADRPLAQDLEIRGRRIAVTAWPSFVQGNRVGATLLLQDRTELMVALDELRSQRTRLTSMRRETHEFDNRLHVVAGLLSLGRHEDAARLLAVGGGPTEPEAPVEPEAIDDPTLAALLYSLIRRGRAAGIEVTVTQDSVVRGRPGGDGAPTSDGAATTIIGNLVTNAIEEARGEVQVYLRGDAEGFECVVEDDGPGIAPEVRETLFEEGVSTKGGAGSRAPSDAGEGVVAGRGIGLFLVHSLVASRGGDIVVGGSSLGGASFEVRIPADGTDGAA